MAQAAEVRRAEERRDGAEALAPRRGGVALSAAAIGLLWLLGPSLASLHAQSGIAVGYVGALGLAAVAIRRGAAVAFLLAVGGGGVTLAAALRGAAGFHPLLVTAALLMAYPLVARGSAEPLAPASRLAGRIAFSALLLVASFGGAGHAMRFATPAPGVFFVAMVPVTVVLAVTLLRGLRRAEIDALARGEALLATATIPALLAGLSLPTATGAVLVANLAIAFLAFGRIARGVSRQDAVSLREGLVLAIALVLARLLELAGHAVGA